MALDDNNNAILHHLYTNKFITEVGVAMSLHDWKTIVRHTVDYGVRP